jgi:GTPase Era involved in 16S rRNA processing
MERKVSIMLTFSEYKNKTLDFYGICGSFVRTNGFDSFLTQINAAKQLLEKQDVNILVLGEARRGKSKLIAALLNEEELFPSFEEVTTCTATKAVYGNNEKVTVTFLDGRTKVISRESIPEYAVDKNNVNNEKGALYITVETPNPVLQKGMCVIDTPGVGSLRSMHTEVTYRMLEEADVVLFISDAGSQINKEEVKFLNDVKRKCDNFIFVLTKIDANAEYDEMMEQNRKTIHQETGISYDKINYIPVSAQNYLTAQSTGNKLFASISNFQALKNAINIMVATKRLELIISPSLAKVEGVLRNLNTELDIRMAAAGGEETEEKLHSLERQLNEITAKRTQLMQDKSIWMQSLRSEIHQIGMERKSSIQRVRTELKSFLYERVQNENYYKDPPQLGEEIETRLRVEVQMLDNEVMDKLFTLETRFQQDNGIGLYDVNVKSGLSDMIPTASINVQKHLKPSLQRTVQEAVTTVVFWPITMFLRKQIDEHFRTKEIEKNWPRKEVPFTREDIPRITANIESYLNDSIQALNAGNDAYISAVSNNFINALEKAVRESKAQSDSQVKLLVDLRTEAQADVQKAKREAERMKKVTFEFDGINKRLVNLEKLIADAKTEGEFLLNKTTTAPRPVFENPDKPKGSALANAGFLSE